jgi:hypothetical protein
MKVYGGVNMATNKFYYKSLSELQKLAESYKTNLIPNLTTRQDPVYTIADVSKTEFDNITTFLYNSVVKDAKLIERNESIYSLEFSSYLMKYFGEGLSLSDVVSLKKFVDSYNLTSFQYMVNNINSYVFGLTTASREIDPLSFIGKMTTDIKNKLTYITEKSQNQSIKKNVVEWFGGVSNIGSNFNIKEFLRYLNDSKIVEAIVILMIASYLSEEGVYQYDESLTRNNNLKFSTENFYVNNINNITLNTRDQYFTNKTAIVTEESVVNGKLQSIEIRNDNGSLVLKMPFKLLTNNNITVENYNYIDDSILNTNIASGVVTISFDNLFLQLKSNLLEFIDLIKIEDFTGINNINQELYNSNISYFLDSTAISLVLNLTKDIQEIVQTFYYKDKIIDNFYANINEEEKRDAGVVEQSKAQSGEQITIIDVKGLDFSSYSQLQLSEVRSLFNVTFEEGQVGSFTVDTDTDNERLVRLTYTLIYKELNPVLRQLILSDIQEYKFARLFKEYNYNEKLILELNKTEGISFLNTLENVYRSYSEQNLVFDLEDSLRYRYFYSNVHIARLSDESDIIGYYIGDNTPQSSFTNNYGYYDYQKIEIMNFLEVYKTTRDYYYRVLLNKSFIQDDTYFLYEKLFIGWVAIERFLTLKLDNLRDPDSLNDVDIYNFLESYGLGILNQYDFFLGSKNYKTNIIKNFASLNKLKGSKDVIDLLGSIFDVGDVLVDINKFLLIDISLIDISDQNTLSENIDIFTDTLDGQSYELKYKLNSSNISTGIKVYDLDRIYYFNGKFVNADGEEKTIESTINYIFDEENYKLYSFSTTNGVVTITPVSFTIRSTVPSPSEQGFDEDIIYFNEIIEAFYLGSKPQTYTNVSVVSDLPRTLNDGDIFYITSKNNFYRKNNKTCELFKAYNYFPSIIEENIGLKLDIFSSTYRDLSVYDGFVFYTGSIATNNLSLKRYSFLENAIQDLTFIITSNIPKEKYVIDVPWWRFLIKAEFVTRQEYERNILLYNYIDNNLNNDKIYLDVNNYILSSFDFNIPEQQAKKLNLIKATKELSSGLRFLEVPYSSDNGTREIQSRLESAVPYNSFLEINDLEKIDPYWTKENVPEETLKEIGLDVVETKYLSLIISENIYKKYITSRYILSTIEYLETIFVSEGISIADNIEIEAGLFQNETLYNYYQVVKVLFKTVLKLYSARVEEIAPTINLTLKKYYGINQNINWDFLEGNEGYFAKYINDFLSIKDEFLNNSVSSSSAGSNPEIFNKFNLYTKDNTKWRSFDNNALFYNEEKVIENTKPLTAIATILRNSLFSTHKLNQNIVQQNSGEYVLELFENLNWLRISGSDGNPQIATKSKNFLNLFTSRFYDINYNAAPNISIKDRSQVYFNIIEKIVKFPVDYIDGLLNDIFIRENINRNKPFVELAELIFNNVYMVDGTPVLNGEVTVGFTDPALVTNQTFEGKNEILEFLENALEILNSGTDNGDNINELNSTELDELIAIYSEKLINILGSLETIFSGETLMQISFALRENEQQTLDFLKQAIELFLSYTTQLYSTRFIREYRTPSESPIFSEKVTHRLNQNKADYALYDEKLEIKEV